LLGTVASLNVSVATGICLFETRRQRCPGTPERAILIVVAMPLPGG
jgi:hypothetical protein